MIDLSKRQYPYLEEVNLGVTSWLTESSAGLEILDVGAGRGALAQAMKKMGHRVTAIEGETVAFETLRGRVDEAFQVDLQDFSKVRELLSGRRFDRVVFSDVCEHVVDPQTVLEQYRDFLKQNGTLVISVPNAVVWDNRLKIFFGNFDYADSGVMDATHLRFFTKKSAIQLVQAAGYDVIRRDFTPQFIRAFLPILKKVLFRKSGAGTSAGAILDSPGYRFYLKWIYPIELGLCRLNGGLFGFRILVEAKVKRG